MAMEEDMLGKFVAVLTKYLGDEPILVGALSIAETAAPVETKDTDFLVTSFDMEKSEEVVDKINQQESNFKITKFIKTTFEGVYLLDVTHEGSKFRVDIIDQYNFTPTGGPNFY